MTIEREQSHKSMIRSSMRAINMNNWFYMKISEKIDRLDNNDTQLQQNAFFLTEKWKQQYYRWNWEYSNVRANCWSTFWVRTNCVACAELRKMYKNLYSCSGTFMMDIHALDIQTEQFIDGQQKHQYIYHMQIIASEQRHMVRLIISLAWQISLFVVVVVDKFE